MVSVASRFSPPVTGKSPLSDVGFKSWLHFCQALEVQPLGAVSESGGLGAFDIRPRRLVEIGYAKALPQARSAGGRAIQSCEFFAPWTKQRFLSDMVAQTAALSRSMSLYAEDLRSGKLKRPDGVSLAGALAILHVGGRGALASWPDLFDNTRARYEVARGAF